jgi:hypothetical protein
MAQKLKLDKELLKRAEEHAARAGYSSLSEFVSHLIERELAAAGAAPDAEAAKKRLQGLGYID